MATLERWNQLTDFITVLLWTGQVANGRPQSCFLISEPGHGKTEMLERFKPNPQAWFWSDLTYRTVIHILRNKMRQNATHIVCTEFQKVINRKDQTAQNTLAILLQMIEEGVYVVGYGPRVIDLGGARMGILAATTLGSIVSKPRMIRELEINSRAFFIDARGTQEELEEIERRILRGDVRSLKPLQLAFPEQPVKVSVPPRVAAPLSKWRIEMQRKGLPVYGNRTVARFLRTLMGVTLLNGRDIARSSDVEYLYTFKKLWMCPPPLPGIDDIPEAEGNLA